MADIYINAGELRQTIQIQQQGTTRGSTGGQSTAGPWTTIRTARAKIMTVSSSEKYQAGQFSAQVSHAITIRYRSTQAITAGMRAVYATPDGTTHTYLIQDVDNVLQRNVKLILNCLEIDGGQ